MKKFTLAALFMFSLSSQATVSFDFGTGAGFVGRGDIIENLGKESLDAPIKFTYEEEAKYELPCRKDNDHQVIEIDFKRNRSVDASIIHDVRKNKQGHVTGYLLNGFSGTLSSEGELSCPGGFEKNGEPVLVSLHAGGLYANGVLILDSADQEESAE
jgi:hypothetical protein